MSIRSAAALLLALLFAVFIVPSKAPGALDSKLVNEIATGQRRFHIGHLKSRIIVVVHPRHYINYFQISSRMRDFDDWFVFDLPRESLVRGENKALYLFGATPIWNFWPGFLVAYTSLVRSPSDETGFSGMVLSDAAKNSYYYMRIIGRGKESEILYHIDRDMVIQNRTSALRMPFDIFGDTFVPINSGSSTSFFSFFFLNETTKYVFTDSTGNKVKTLSDSTSIGLKGQFPICNSGGAFEIRIDEPCKIKRSEQLTIHTGFIDTQYRMYLFTLVPRVAMLKSHGSVDLNPVARKSQKFGVSTLGSYLRAGVPPNYRPSSTTTRAPWKTTTFKTPPSDDPYSDYPPTNDLPSSSKVVIIIGVCAAFVVVIVSIFFLLVVRKKRLAKLKRSKTVPRNSKVTTNPSSPSKFSPSAMLSKTKGGSTFKGSSARGGESKGKSSKYSLGQKNPNRRSPATLMMDNSSTASGMSNLSTKTGFSKAMRLGSPGGRRSSPKTMMPSGMTSAATEKYTIRSSLAVNPHRNKGPQTKKAKNKANQRPKLA